MLRSVTRVLLLGVLAVGLNAAILPERIDTFTRGDESPVAVTGKAVWDEFGLDDAAQADYKGPGGTFHLTVYRMKDSTGAMAAWRWQRPAGSTPSKFDKLAAETPRTLTLAFGNFVFQYDGRRPTVREFEELLAKLPKLENASLPALPGFLPVKGKIAGSDRYILGPASLEQFAPAVSPGTAGFSMGAEGVSAKYASPSGQLDLVIFSYPTPQMARERTGEFQKMQGAFVKRSGPLVALVLPPANADAAERTLAEVRYEANITLNQKVPGKGEDPGTMIVSIFTLAGMLMLFAAAGGVAMGGFRLLWQKITGNKIAQDAMIVLHLQDK
jgi:hypothetical protein